MFQGKGNYKPKKGFENAWHVIGEGDNPVYVCKKKEVPKLFNDYFWKMFQLWRLYHYRMIKIDEGYDPLVMNTILEMEEHYEKHFSMDSVMIKYQEAIIRNLHALGRGR